MSKDPKDEGRGLFGRLKSILSREHIKSPASVPGHGGETADAAIPGAHDVSATTDTLELTHEMLIFRAVKPHIQKGSLPPSADLQMAATPAIPDATQTKEGIGDDFEFFRKTIVKKQASSLVFPPVPTPPPAPVSWTKVAKVLGDVKQPPSLPVLTPPPHPDTTSTVYKAPVDAKIPPPHLSPAKIAAPVQPPLEIPRTVPPPPPKKSEAGSVPPVAQVRAVMAPELAVQVSDKKGLPADAKETPEKKTEAKAVPPPHPPKDAGEMPPQVEFKQFSGSELDKIRMPKKEESPGASGKQTVRRIELESNRERKKKPKVVLPPAEEPKPVGSRLRSLKFTGFPKVPMAVWIALLVLFLIAAGTGIYLLSRETSVTGRVELGDLQLVDQPAVVYNFSGKLDLLKSDYAKRVAPLNEQLKGIGDNLAAARADIAVRQQKLKMLDNQITALEAEIPKYIEASQTQLDDLWKKQGTELDREYSETKQGMHQEIEARAKNNGLKYERNKEIDALDVAVNSYKLSLYAAPKSVKVDEERAFGEELLGRWKKFEADWQTRQMAIKDKALEIKKQPGPKIDDAKTRIEMLRTDTASLNEELASLQAEQVRYEKDKKEIDDQVAAVTTQFVNDLMILPKEFIKLKVPLEADSSVQMRNLQEKAQDLPPGTYIFFVRAKSGEETFWATKDFVIREYEHTQLNITRQDFVPAQNFLK